MTTKKRIDNEYKRIKCLFYPLKANQQELIEQQIQNAAFLAVTLQDLQSSIIKNGYTEEYTNGANQAGVKVSADLQGYNQTLKSYNATIKQLMQMLPNEMHYPAGSKLENFIREY